MIAHGTASKYSNDACRCTECRKAWAAWNQKRRKERAAAIPDDIHGKASTYTNWQCHCNECRKAHAIYQRAIYQRRSKKDKT